MSSAITDVPILLSHSTSSVNSDFSSDPFAQSLADQSDFDSSSLTSSDEEDGVYFGTHTEQEKTYLSRLSIQTPLRSQSSSNHTVSDSAHRARKLKRDSREFHRRRTLCLSGHDNEDGQKKAWAGGFYEKTLSTMDDDRSIDHDLELNGAAESLSSLRLSACSHPLSKAPSNDAHDCASESEFDGELDSDKENVMQTVGSTVPQETVADNVEEYTISLGLRDQDTESEEEDLSVNFGGMTIQDFDDPISGGGGEIGEPKEAEYASSDSGDMNDVAGVLDSPTIHASLPDLANQSEQEVIGLLEEKILEDDLLDHEEVRAPAIPLEAKLQPIRAEMGSPFRALPEYHPAVEDDHFVDFPSIVSPPRIQSAASPSKFHSSSLISPRVNNTGEPVGRTTSLKSPFARSLPLAAAGEVQQFSKKEKSRALAVRSRLESTLLGSMNAPLGAPKRTVSGSSSSSSGSRPPSRNAVSIHPPSKGATKPLASSLLPTHTHFPPSGTVSKTYTKSSIPAAALGRVPVSNSKPMLSISRPILAPRSLEQHPPRQPPQATTSKTTAPANASSPKRSSLTISKEGNRSAVSAPARPNPLKRPLPSSTSGAARPAMPIGSSARPVLGLPARLVRDIALPSPSFNVGSAEPVFAGPSAISRATHNSPAKPNVMKRSIGTPSTLRKWKVGFCPKLGADEQTATPVKAASVAVFEKYVPSFPSSTQSSLPVETGTTCDAASATTSNTGQNEGALSRVQHNDSADPTALPPPAQSTRSSSPTVLPPPSIDLPRVPPVNRPVEQPESPRSHFPSMRRIRAITNKPVKAPLVNTASQVSEKELKATTLRNTMRNQVYHCAIDRQIVRKAGPRPPSPTSKIRTTADRDEEEKKKGRGQRAKRRAREDPNYQGDSDSDDEQERPLVERVEKPRGPGDDEDWKTPFRPAKKLKTGSEKTKNVTWDKGLVIIRNDGSGINLPATEAEEPQKGAMRTNAKLQLDKFGNVVEGTRPKEDLKRMRIVVTAVFYDGEEPVPVPDFPSLQNNSGKGKKK